MRKLTWYNALAALGVTLAINGLAASAPAQSEQQDRRKENSSKGTDTAEQRVQSGANRDNGQNRTARSGNDQQSSGSPAQGEAIDQHVANCLILGNQEEIALARFALERAQSEETKQFAQMMLDDHSKFVSELEKFASHPAAQIKLDRSNATGAIENTGRTETDRAVQGTRTGGGTSANQATPGNAGTPGTPGVDRNAVPVAGQNVGGTANAEPGENPAPSGRAGSTDRVGRRTPDTAGSTTTGHQGSQQLSAEHIFAMELKEKQTCLQMTKKDLEKEQGADFDKAFVGMQIGMHTGMLAKLQTAKDAVSEELRPTIEKGISTTREHKQHAIDLMSKLKAEGTSDEKKSRGSSTK